MNSIDKKKKAIDTFTRNVSLFISQNRPQRKAINTKPPISILSSLELIDHILSSNVICQNSLTIYNGALVSNDIGSNKIDVQLQLRDLDYVLLNSKKETNQAIENLTLTYKKPKIKDIPTKTESMNSLSSVNYNLHKSIESLSYGKFIPKNTTHYQDQSLQEFLNEEIKNIKRSNTIIYSDTPTLSPKEKKTINMIQKKYRPATPNPSNPYYKKPLKENNKVYQNFDTIEYYNNNDNINILTNKNLNKKKNIPINSKISYNTFRSSAKSKPQAQKQEKKQKKEIPSFIKLQKQKNFATIKVFDQKVYNQNKAVNKSSFNTINTPKKINNKNSFYSRPMTSNTSRNISFMTSPKMQIHNTASNVGGGGLFNIKIDLRELMKDDYDETFKNKNLPNCSFRSETSNKEKRSIDRLIIEQKLDENGNIII